MRDAIASGVVVIILAAAYVASELWDYLRNLDRHTGRRHREHDDRAMRDDLRRRGDSQPRWRP